MQSSEKFERDQQIDYFWKVKEKKEYAQAIITAKAPTEIITAANSIDENAANSYHGT